MRLRYKARNSRLTEMAFNLPLVTTGGYRGPEDYTGAFKLVDRKPAASNAKLKLIEALE